MAPELSRLFGFVLGSTVVEALPEPEKKQIRQDMQDAETMEDLKPWQRTIVNAVIGGRKVTK